MTKAVFAVDVGLPINPLGLKAQMMGGIMDGIAQALTYSLHLKDGHFLEGSWDNAYYTREWNTPFEVEVIVMPPTTGDPGRRGRARRRRRRWRRSRARTRGPPASCRPSFPINHNLPLGFTPLSDRARRFPQSPTDGLQQRLTRSDRAHSHLHPQRQAGAASTARTSVRLLWVLRDLLGVHGPKYGCGLEVCKACTSHINGKAFNPCSVPVSQIKPTRPRSRRSRGSRRPSARSSTRCRRRGSSTTSPSAATASRADHGGGRARQGGPGEGRQITDADLDGIRNICRCGTYPRIREAIMAGPRRGM